MIRGITQQWRRHWSWWLGLAVFTGIIGWMLHDILQRDTALVRREEVLVMGTNAGFRPFEYRSGDEVVGFDVDLAKEIAASLGKKLKIEDMSFDGLLPALESGQIDMAVAGMSATPERAKNALFSEAYYTAAQRVIVKKSGPIHNRFQLEGRKLGVQLGTTGDTLATKIAGAKVSQFPTAPSVLTELSSGGVDAVILDDAPAKQYIRSFPELVMLPGDLSKEAYAIAVKRGNQPLVDSINATIKAMKQDGRYQKLIDKHFQ